MGLRGRLKVKDEELKKELKEKGLFCCVYRAAAKDFFSILKMFLEKCSQCKSDLSACSAVADKFN